MSEKWCECMSSIYLDRIIMVYSHKTHALAKLEVENVLSIGILILIAVNSVSKECYCGIFNQQNLYPSAIHLSVNDAKKKREKMSQATNWLPLRWLVMQTLLHRLARMCRLWFCEQPNGSVGGSIVTLCLNTFHRYCDSPTSQPLCNKT